MGAGFLRLLCKAVPGWAKSPRASAEGCRTPHTLQVSSGKVPGEGGLINSHSLFSAVLPRGLTVGHRSSYCVEGTEPCHRPPFLSPTPPPPSMLLVTGGPGFLAPFALSYSKLSPLRPSPGGRVGDHFLLPGLNLSSASAILPGQRPPPGCFL